MEQKTNRTEMHIMVDIETLGINKEKAPILSIGAVCFDMGNDFDSHGEKITKEGEGFWSDGLGDTFYIVLNVEQQKEAGRKIDQSTWDWWHKEERLEEWEEMQKAQECAGNYFEGMLAFYRWLIKLSEKHTLYVWSRGIDFDFPIIESAWRQLGITENPPYFYAHKEEVRTVINMMNRCGHKIGVGKTVQHNALSDCIKQATEVMAAFNIIKASVGNVRG